MPTPDDLQFKELSLANHLVTEEQLNECIEALENYELAGIKKPLSAIMLDKGIINAKQMNAIHQLQGKTTEYAIRGYTILETLGQGGLGTVYKAQKNSIGKIVALKVMFPHLCSNKEYVQRFMREARVSAELEHPNIVQGIDFGECDGLYFFAMEFVDGKSLKHVLQEKGKFEEKEAAQVILKIAEALKYAEHHNLVHRDIKPENIMITKDGVPKLCDLGLAKTLDSDMSLTRTGIVMGTPHYISPEQAVGQKDLDIRSDIYSLGVSFYNLISGQVPYTGTTVISIISQHLSSNIPSLKDKNPEVSEDVCKIIYKMMAKKRDDRYQTAQELIVDLKRFLQKDFSIQREQSEPIAIYAPLDPTAKRAKHLNDDKPTAHTPALPKEANKPVAEEDVTKEMLEIVKAATMNMNQDATSAVLAEAVQLEKERKEKENLEKVEEEPEKKVQETRKFVQKLEKQAEMPATSTTGTRRHSGIRIFLFLVVAGLGLLGYMHQKEVIEWCNMTLEKVQKMIKPDPNPIPIPAPTYKPWDDFKLHEAKFKEQSKAIQPLKLDQQALLKDMVLIPGGTFNMGSAQGETDETPKKTSVETFWIDKYEVNNRAYCQFCSQTGASFPKGLPEGLATPNIPDYPVTNVSYYDATLYAKWMGKRLPTEAEWEYAAKTSVGYEYPWGPHYRPDCANIETGKISTVFQYPAGKTSTGIFNMSGNVWEWTSSCYESKEENCPRDYVIKGGSFSYSPFYARSSYRDGLIPCGKRDDLGFRCALNHQENK